MKITVYSYTFLQIQFNSNKLLFIKAVTKREFYTSACIHSKIFLSSIKKLKIKIYKTVILPVVL